ncbi:hypothetical protein [Malikia spinosa]|uniref:hypothetical protein n=1 Tax=Malikia spinosa TaxID=86180 RepID=UPI002FD9F7A4
MDENTHYPAWIDQDQRIRPTPAIGQAEQVLNNAMALEEVTRAEKMYLVAIMPAIA